MTSEDAVSLFHGISSAPQTPIARAMAECRDDHHSEKVDLLLGVYQDDNGDSLPMAVVKIAERLACTIDDTSYVPATGLESFTKVMTRLLLGELDSSRSSPPLHVAAVQTISSTCGLYLTAKLLLQCGSTVIYLSKPTWGHHEGVVRRGGFTEVREYRYCKYSDWSLDFEGMISDLKEAPARAVVLLQPCSHNPTGINPTRQQWDVIIQTIKDNRLVPVWDNAFQGLESGDLDLDAWPVRRCVTLGMEFLCVQTTAKYFRLNNHRSGNLVIAAHDRGELRAVVEQVANTASNIYNSPPGHGARIVCKILGNPQLVHQWKQEVKEMADRTKAMRALLRKKLEDLGTPGSWSYITDQAGMFTLLSLNLDQIYHARKTHHVYILDSGRINVCAINPQNVERIAVAVYYAVLKCE